MSERRSRSKVTTGTVSFKIRADLHEVTSSYEFRDVDKEGRKGREGGSVGRGARGEVETVKVVR